MKEINKTFSLINGIGLREEKETAEYFVKELGKDQAILHCHSMSCYCFGKHKIGMAEYWKKVVDHIEQKNDLWKILKK